MSNIKHANPYNDPMVTVKYLNNFAALKNSAILGIFCASLSFSSEVREPVHVVMYQRNVFPAQS